MISQKSEIFIHPSFKPLTLNVKKALDIVNKFEMTPGVAAPNAQVVNENTMGGGADNGLPQSLMSRGQISPEFQQQPTAPASSKMGGDNAQF